MGRDRPGLWFDILVINHFNFPRGKPLRSTQRVLHRDAVSRVAFSFFGSLRISMVAQDAVSIKATLGPLTRSLPRWILALSSV